MEGDPEESDDDVAGRDRSAVLWEKCIQQSIFVDLSEDESLHLSDLESSFAVHLSQAESTASEASIHLSGSAELSALDDTSSDCSSVSSQSERVVEGKTKSSIVRVSPQRPNTVHKEPPLTQGYEDPGQNTSDEDQEDLPYDGDLGSRYFNHTAGSEGNMSSDGGETLHGSPEGPESTTVDRDNNIIEDLASVESNAMKPASRSLEEVNTKQDCFIHASNPSEGAPLCKSPVDEARQPDINQLLLRHFSQEELLCSGRLIEAETLPEMSLLESMDDTLVSWAPRLSCTEMPRNDSSGTGSHAGDSENNQSQEYGSRTDEKSNTASEISASLEEEAETKSNNVTSTATDCITSKSTDSKQDSGESTALDLLEQEKAKEDAQAQRVSLVRTRSFSEMKYGQGQVHYPLPDFSKVAPKVKIPKSPSGPARPIAQSPSTMHRAQSSPGILEVISRVLEDSVQPSEKPYVFKDQDKQTAPALVHHLQAEYDKLLTKYAEAENLIDQMRLGTKAQAPSELLLDLDCDDHQDNLVEESHFGSFAPPPPPSGRFLEEPAPQSSTKELNTASSSQLDEQDPSDGEKMTAELTDIISQFMQKVDEFKLSISSMSVSTAELQMMLRSMMEAQDQLERKYISKKEEHRALEMQNYMGLSRNTGTFDPDRLVEGDIFRIGMHLEDIKEMIDRNVCEQLSPPHSSSTPTPTPESLSVKSTPSPPPSQQEGPSAGLSTVGYEMGRGKEEKEEKGEEEEASEVHDDGGLEQSSELMTIDSLLNNIGHSSCHPRSSQGSVEGLDITTAEDEEGEEEDGSSITSEGIGRDNILAYLSETNSSSRLRQWTPESIGTQDSVLTPESECDLGASVSRAVEVSCSSDALKTQSLSESALNSSSISQRIVSPETDSGFGSSYLSQPATSPFHPKLLTESVQLQNDGLSGSDSEGSCSNLQTAIHSATLTGQRRASPHSSVQTQSCGAGAAVERWVESTTKEPPVRLQESDPNLPTHLHQHLSEPILSITMDTVQRDSHLYSCSCNSEAILALQSEVSRLKKDLEDGLVQLPHLAQRMDYLTSKYRQDRQDRRSKTRPRTHHKPPCNSLVKIEDWISSDMDPSKSKGTDSSDTADSEVMLQFHSAPVGSRRGSGSLCSGSAVPRKPQGKQHSSRAGDMESVYSKERWSLFSSPPLHKPLLQVNYGSSCSLPASYKVREPPPQSVSHQWKRSTQSDTALLPSNVYFQRTLSPVLAPSKTGSRASRRRGSKEEEMNRTLDLAIETARSMKRTTDRMAKSLSADLAKAQLYRRLHTMQPLGGRNHNAF
ncbi:serine-rich adhesin for platelets-like [Centroberyx affinis]|uniref:serine-rich adhesin for platelets-like n=1 Tax=Centroberyx affinis TaxID=166261 RepID=UPI003A5C0032